MKLSKIILAMGMGAVLVSAAANAADEAAKSGGQGVVNFKGSIVDAPCSISGDSVEQTVNLGAVSSASLQNGGTSSPRTFDIKLQDCALTTANTVTTTFTGTASKANPANLGIVGRASGASISITDAAGTPIKLGTASAAQKLSDGNNTLRFAAFLQGDGSSAITAGDFTSVADFTLSYQ